MTEVLPNTSHVGPPGFVEPGTEGPRWNRATAPAVAGGRVRGMAVGLWAVVGTLLGYGILTTAIKAAALFG